MTAQQSYVGPLFFRAIHSWTQHPRESTPLCVRLLPSYRSFSPLGALSFSPSELYCWDASLLQPCHPVMAIWDWCEQTQIGFRYMEQEIGSLPTRPPIPRHAQPAAYTLLCRPALFCLVLGPCFQRGQRALARSQGVVGSCRGSKVKEGRSLCRQSRGEANNQHMEHQVFSIWDHQCNRVSHGGTFECLTVMAGMRGHGAGVIRITRQPWKRTVQIILVLGLYLHGVVVVWRSGSC